MRECQPWLLGLNKFHQLNKVNKKTNLCVCVCVCVFPAAVLGIFFFVCLSLKLFSLLVAHKSYKTSLAWSVVNEISGQKESSRGRICAGNLKERIKLWKEHFEGLLGQPPIVDDQSINRVFNALPIKTSEFTMTELREAIKSTQGNKATGLDGIQAEVWKLECFRDQVPEV